MAVALSDDRLIGNKPESAVTLVLVRCGRRSLFPDSYNAGGTAALLIH
jgi:hypothetical protein